MKDTHIAIHVIGVAAFLKVLGERPKRRRRGHTIEYPKSIQSRLLFELNRHPGIHLWDDLVDVIWGHRGDGGPLHATKILHLNVCFLRKLHYKIITYPMLGLQLIQENQPQIGAGPVSLGISLDS
jgi:hypothetical protein